MTPVSIREFSGLVLRSIIKRWNWEHDFAYKNFKRPEKRVPLEKWIEQAPIRAIDTESLTDLRTALDELSNQNLNAATVLDLKYFNDMTNSEISSLLGLSEVQI